MSLDPKFVEAVRAILDETTTLTLATIDSDDTPRATPLFFATAPDLSLIFLSDPTTPHIRNLERAPAVAVAIYPAVMGWREIRGLQLQGEVTSIARGQREFALSHYQKRFPFIQELPEALAAGQIYRFSPTWIRLIDNRQGFGHKEEVQL